MKYLIIAFCLLAVGCEKETSPVDTVGCATEAVVKDLTGLDGCGFVFELADGTRLIPEHRTYIQAPKKEDDPIYYFQMKDSEKVKISYRESQLLGVCMAGPIVFITCITPLEKTGE